MKEFIKSAHGKIPMIKKILLRRRKHFSPTLTHGGISEEFIKQVDDFIERYRAALESLAKK